MNGGLPTHPLVEQKKVREIMATKKSPVQWQMLIAMSILLLSCTLLPHIWPNNNDSTSKSALLREFIVTDCEEFCWLGIEIGRTTREEAINILEENGLVYDTVGIDIGVQLESNDLWSTVGNPQVAIYLDNDVVAGFAFPIQVCIFDLFEAHGTPLVRSHYTDGLGDSFDLIYPDLGVTYFLDRDEKYTHHAIIASREITKLNARDTHASAWDDNFEIGCDSSPQ
jgi:hypothetical protein